LQLAARSLLTDFAAEFEAASWRNVVGHLLRPLVAGRGAVGGAGRRLGDIRFQLDALRWRERQLLAEVGRRVKRRTDRGDGADEAFLANQDGAIEVALAHTERVTLEQLAAAVDVSPDECRPVLTQLCRLYGLIRMEAA